VDKLVEVAGLGTNLARWSLLWAARETLAATRADILDGSVGAEVEESALVERTRRRAALLESPYPRRVINATGVVLHTNLGRAPLAAGAAQEVVHSATGYSDLEIELTSGERGSRQTRVAELLCQLSGAEAALVVNNNAGALLLCVDTLAAGREVVLSRGELVEIGGSFRVPEIMASSRARLREIGTTNRTHLADYEGAICEHTGLLLKVHRSNFRLEGFTAEVGLAELAALGREHGLPVVEDRGSGTFVDLRPHGIPEAAVWEGLLQGADLVLFSGDKLLGGPQLGIALGRRDLIEPMKRSPLARALRVDKLSLAAVHWTLRALLDERLDEIPVLRMLLEPHEAVAARAEELAKKLRPLGFDVDVERGVSPVGGGALPDLELQGAVVRLVPRSSATDAARRLRTGDPPVLVRVHRDALLLDPRTLDDEDVAALIAVLAGWIDGRSGSS
jgi:L-seryl-tRNA(Ser) seleniumtransferase